MLSLFKKEKSLNSVAKGKIVDITHVPDQVFSQKILGDGFAVIPSDGNIFSPTDGTVTEVSETLHAYCITNRDGLEILVHIGIDTVELKGSGFSPLVKKGDSVSAGAPLAHADLKTIKERGFHEIVVVAVTNSDKLKSFKVLENNSASPSTPAFIYKI